jgi:hypothetical protein
VPVQPISVRSECLVGAILTIWRRLDLGIVLTVSAHSCPLAMQRARQALSDPNCAAAVLEAGQTIYLPAPLVNSRLVPIRSADCSNLATLSGANIPWDSTADVNCSKKEGRDRTRIVSDAHGGLSGCAL